MNPSYKDGWRIITITPATGWWALFGEGGTDMPVACWALVETNDNNRMVVGIDAQDGGFIEDFTNFKKYKYQPTRGEV